MRAIAFEPVQHGHIALLERWLRQPHWREWWGDPDEELGHIVDMIEGRDATRPFLFLAGGAPAGYIQYWFVGPHQTDAWAKDNPWLMELPSDAVGVDLSVGEEHDLSKGIGSAALRAFTGRLREKGHRTIVIDPENARAVRAYEKAGFRPVPRLAGRTAGVLIMQHQPGPSGRIT